MKEWLAFVRTNYKTTSESEEILLNVKRSNYETKSR